jgi:rfaE bifunctional protein nucleotidyltransferase chain/domain
MIPGKVSCLQATYGRYTDVCRSLACFLAQDYENRELVILNNHPVPLVFDHPKVRIVNEHGHPTLGHCRQRLLDFADGEYCRTWDDDDLYMPWAISQGVERIEDRRAWKPGLSWGFNGPESIELHGNTFEASATWRTDFVKSIGYKLAMGDEHRPLLDFFQSDIPHGGCGYWASYAYSWGLGGWHCSGSLGNGQTVEQRTATWQGKNQDTGNGQPLKPSNLLPWWRKIVRRVPAELQNAWMLAALGQGPAGVILHREYCQHAFVKKTCFTAETFNARRPAGRIVATTGCFDLLHSGHVRFLDWAADQGDFLVVLVNDDGGVTAQKGEDRPLISLIGRHTALTSLPFVAAVIPISGADDLPTLEAIRPDIFVKGPDYAGREHLIPRPEGCELRIAPANEFAFHTSDLVGA